MSTGTAVLKMVLLEKYILIVRICFIFLLFNLQFWLKHPYIALVARFPYLLV